MEDGMGESVTSARAAGWYRDPPGGYEYGYWDGSSWRPDVSAAVHLMHANSAEKFFYQAPGARQDRRVRV
jgi:hypothetical protein